MAEGWNKSENIKRNRKILVLGIVLAILLTVAVYFFFIYKPECKTISCFTSALVECRKSTFISKQETSSWLYSINGKNSAGCGVYVKAVSITSDAETQKALEGKSMICNIPPQDAGISPESKIENCHGILKEGIQDQIIKKMHLFIIQNIGQIEEAEII